MKSSELNRRAKKAGWVFFRQDVSIHRYYYDKYGEILCIPFHGSKEVPSGTCREILKRIGYK
jgi:predicted RNA binding protein YcfA (HicA-like mRNA interferase family)